MTSASTHTRHQTAQTQPSLIPAVLTVLVHALLLVALYFGMNWQPPQPVEVELWDGEGLAATQQAAPAAPAATPMETPTVEEKPQKPIVTETQPETPPQAADINTPAAKKPLEKPTDKPIDKPVEKSVEKPSKPIVAPETKTTSKPTTPPADSATRAAALARLKSSSGTASGSAASSGGSTGDASAYAARVKQRVEAQAKMRIAGQTLSASASVRLAPNGAVISKSIVRSSGNAAWDADLLAAISRSSPFPTPVHEAALRGITLNFRH